MYSAEINTGDYIISSASGETVPAISACGVTSLTYGDTYFQSVDSTPSRASSWRSTTIPVVAPPYYNLVNNCGSFPWSSSSFGDLRRPMLRATRSRSTEWISSTLTSRRSIQAATSRCPPTPSRIGATSSTRPTPRLANQAQAPSSAESRRRRYRRFLAGMQATVVGIRTATAAVSLCRSPSSSTSTTTPQSRPQAQSRSTPAGRFTLVG